MYELFYNTHKKAEPLTYTRVRLREHGTCWGRTSEHGSEAVRPFVYVLSSHRIETPLCRYKHGSERRSPGVRRLSGVYESRVKHRKRGGDGFVHRRGGNHPNRPHPLRHHPPPLG